jgi:hypothetical protein
MSIALHSAFMAASCYLAGESSGAYHRRMRGDIAGQFARAGLLNRAVRSNAGQTMLMCLGALWPSGLRLAARLTRLPDRAVSRMLACGLSPDRTIAATGPVVDVARKNRPEDGTRRTPPRSGGLIA